MGQTGTQDNASQLLSRFHAQNGEVGLSSGVNLGSPSHNANRHGEFHAADQISFGVLPPCRHGRVSTVCHRCPGVAPRFDGSPVLAAGKRNAADGVHHAFVVRGRSKGVFDSEGMGFKNAADDGQTVLVGSIRSHFFRCEDGLHPRQSVACKVGKNAEMCASTRQRLEPWSDTFGHGVDRIGSHGITTINQQVNDEHLAHGGG